MEKAKKRKTLYDSECLRVHLNDVDRKKFKTFCDLVGLPYSEFFKISGCYYIKSLGEKIKKGGKL